MKTFEQFRTYLRESTLNEFKTGFRLGIESQNRLKDQDGNIWYGVDISYNMDDFAGGLVQTFEEAVEKKGYFVVPGKTFLRSAQVVVNDAKNQADANKKVKRIAIASRIKNPFIEAAHDLKGMVKDLLNLKTRKRKKPERQTPKFADATPNSHLVVDNIGKDKWIVDRVVPSNPRDRSGGMQGSPYKKKSQALKAAKTIARGTGEEIKISPARTFGGPEVLRKRKS